MKLIYTNASPYARKARIVALEAGIELDLVFAHPTAEGSEVSDYNPLGKVPALIVGDGTLIVDSPVICEFLDQYERTPTLVPPLGPDRIKVLTLQALADGIMDSTVAMVLETRRDPSERSPYWLERWSQSIKRTLPFLERQLRAEDGFNLGTIAAISALHYLEFRFPEQANLADFPTLTEWLGHHENRPCIASTMPFDGPSR